MEEDLPARYEDINPEMAAFMMAVFAGGGRFKQPKPPIPNIILPDLPPIVGMRRNSQCPCGSGKKTKKCHTEWLIDSK